MNRLKLCLWLQVVFGCVFGVMAAEALTRAICPKLNWMPNAPFSPSGLALTPSGSFGLKPNVDTTLVHAFKSHTRVITDHHGWRIPRPDVPRRTEGERILFVGASFAFGFGVEAEDAYPMVFEKLMNEAGHPVRVHNAAVMAHTLPQMLDVLENLPADAPLDRVFIAIPLGGLYILGLGSTAEGASFVDNDGGISNLTLANGGLNLALEDVNGWLLRRDRVPKSPITDWLETKTAVGHRTVRRLYQAFRPQRIVMRTGEIDTKRITIDVRRVAERLAKVTADLKRKNIECAVLLERVNDGILELFARKIDERDMEYFRAFAISSGIAGKVVPVIDNANPNSPYYLPMDSNYGGDFLVPFDSHYSKRGHRRVAQTLVRWMSDTKLRKRG